MATQINRQSLGRTYDYLYDPVYTVCSAKDHYKAAVAASRHSCLFSPCENFPSVFSNQLTYPKHMVKNQADHLYALDPNYSARVRANLGTPKLIETTGKHRHLFFRRPIMPFLTPSVPMLRFHANLDCHGLAKAIKDVEERSYNLPDKMETKQTQTDYRESEAQTSPWTPPYRVQPDESPEVLTIAHLTWGHGLPAGMHEVEIINRMRMKRAWEAILPPMDSESNIKTRTTIIKAIEIDDWAFREAEIQFIMDMRMELMEKYTKLKEEAEEKKTADRYQKFQGLMNHQRDKEVSNIRQKLGRELRKLAAKHRVGETKWAEKCNAAKGLGDTISKTQGPRMRFEQNIESHRGNINERILNTKNVPDVDEDDKYIVLPTYSQLKAVRPKQKASELCVRETRWNEEKLRELHAELKSIRMDLKPEKEISLMKRRNKLPPLPVTPILHGARDENNDREQAAIFIQKLVRGRAIQCMLFEGRDRCRELIEELQSTHWLQSETKKLRQTQKRHVIGLQQDQNRRMLQEDRLSEILNMLEGRTLAGMLDYLSKELIRLKDERKAHAFALLAERERSKREAEEAGRRQLEEQRRREHDEMFRQMVKVNQDSVELYLEDIIKEGMEWVSDAEAKRYIMETADKVDKAVLYANENTQELLEEEMVSDMIYNYVLPDVEKQIVRKRICERQASYLRNAHAAIYNEILELPTIHRNPPSSESEYMEDTSGEKTEVFGQFPIEETRSETSTEWIKRRIIGEIIEPGETLTGSILEHLIDSVVPDNKGIARNVLDEITKEVEARVEDSQLSISISARSAVSGSPGSSYSSEPSDKSSALQGSIDENIDSTD